MANIHATRGIALSHIKYSETSVVASIFTEAFGRQSYMINGIRKQGKKRSNHMALLQPFSLLQMQVYHKQQAHIHRIKEMQIDQPLQSVHFKSHKQTVVMFLAEVLVRAMREEEPDKRLFAFTYQFVRMLDLAREDFASLHVLFLVHLARFLGIQPQNNYHEHAAYFDMQKGRFVQNPPEHYDFLGSAESRWLSELMRTKLYDYHRLKIASAMRADLLDAVIHYLQLHIQGMGAVKSLEVMRALYH